MGQAILTKSKIHKLTCSARALILQAINALRGRETRDYMPTYAYAYNSYKKGKLRVYLIYKLKVLKVSEAHAPLGPTVDTPLVLSLKHRGERKQTIVMLHFCIPHFV